MSPRRAQSFRFGFRFLVIVAILGGATVGVSKLAEAKKGGGAKRAPADNRDCKTDHDCVIVADDCCPCSQGGKARAIPKKQKDTYEKERKKRCADTACTEMMSDDRDLHAGPLLRRRHLRAGRARQFGAKSGARRSPVTRRSPMTSRSRTTSRSPTKRNPEEAAARRPRPTRSRRAASTSRRARVGGSVDAAHAEVAAVGRDARRLGPGIDAQDGRADDARACIRPRPTAL